MSPEKEAANWNERYPEGTAVLFYSVTGAKEGKPTKTTSKAYVLMGHTAVCMIEAGIVAGCVALANLKPQRRQP